VICSLIVSISIAGLLETERPYSVIARIGLVQMCEHIHHQQLGGLVMLTAASTALAFEHIKAVLTGAEDVQSILAVLRVLSLLLQSGGGLGGRARPFFQRTLIPINALLNRLYEQPASDNQQRIYADEYAMAAEEGTPRGEVPVLTSSSDSASTVSVMINALTDIMRVMEVAGGRGTAEEIRSFVATHQRVTDDSSADAHRVDRMLTLAKSGGREWGGGSAGNARSSGHVGSGAPNTSEGYWQQEQREDAGRGGDWLQHHPLLSLPGQQQTQQMRWSSSVKYKEKVEAMQQKAQQAIMQQQSSASTTPHTYWRAGGMGSALPVKSWSRLPHEATHWKQDQSRKHHTKRSRELAMQEKSLRPLVKQIREFAMARAATREGPYSTPQLRRALVGSGRMTLKQLELLLGEWRRVEWPESKKRVHVELNGHSWVQNLSYSQRGNEGIVTVKAKVRTIKQKASDEYAPPSRGGMLHAETNGRTNSCLNEFGWHVNDGRSLRAAFSGLGLGESLAPYSFSRASLTRSPLKQPRPHGLPSSPTQSLSHAPCPPWGIDDRAGGALQGGQGHGRRADTAAVASEGGQDGGGWGKDVRYGWRENEDIGMGGQGGGGVEGGHDIIGGAGSAERGAWSHIGDLGQDESPRSAVRAGAGRAKRRTWVGKHGAQLAGQRTNDGKAEAATGGVRVRVSKGERVTMGKWHEEEEALDKPQPRKGSAPLLFRLVYLRLRCQMNRGFLDWAKAMRTARQVPRVGRLAKKR
jgi:hypothetical protein